jgi:hypothetical protein
MSNNEIVTANSNLPVAHEELKTDLDYTRKNLFELIESGHAALKELAEIAAQSQSAKVYEAFFGGLAKLGELNERLVNVSDKRKRVGTEDQPTGGHVTNNLFVGTPADLQNLLADMNKKKDEEL